MAADQQPPSLSGRPGATPGTPRRCQRWPMTTKAGGHRRQQTRRTRHRCLESLPSYQPTNKQERETEEERIGDLWIAGISEEREILRRGRGTREKLHQAELATRSSTRRHIGANVHELDHGLRNKRTKEEKTKEERRRERSKRRRGEAEPEAERERSTQDRVRSSFQDTALHTLVHA